MPALQHGVQHKTCRQRPAIVALHRDEGRPRVNCCVSRFNSNQCWHLQCLAKNGSLSLPPMSDWMPLGFPGSTRFSDTGPSLTSTRLSSCGVASWRSSVASVVGSAGGRSGQCRFLLTTSPAPYRRMRGRVNHQADVLIVAAGNDRRRPIELRITLYSNETSGEQLGAARGEFHIGPRFVPHHPAFVAALWIR
jgi:hypothetical protein